MMSLCKCFILISLMLLLSNCTTPLKIDPTKQYKLDISIKNRGIEAIGIIALPAKDLYTIDFETEQKINFISFRTCSREIVAEDPSSGLSRKKYSINYRPNEIEAAGACPTIISAFNETGMMSVGYIDYADRHTTLPALNICGENVENNIGVSVCQERVSSIERIRFDVEVLTSPDPGCELDKTRGKEFTYRIKPGYCIYAFMETVAPYRIHRLTTYGYNEIQIRK